jgi:chemotaxis family two-component system response regulator Rcp1
MQLSGGLKVAGMGTRRRTLAVLIVEDDALQARLLRECLERTGLGGNVSTVYDGDEALEWLRRTRDSPGSCLPDLVLLDFRLPGLDGAEVVQAIRAEPGLEHIPVLVVSTSAEPADVQRAYASGANCYIRKPSSFAGGVSMAEAIEEFWLRVATLPRP